MFHNRFDWFHWPETFFLLHNNNNEETKWRENIRRVVVDAKDKIGIGKWHMGNGLTEVVVLVRHTDNIQMETNYSKTSSFL